MNDSDSDLEILEEVPSQRSSCRMSVDLPTAAGDGDDDEGELLDLDDDVANWSWKRTSDNAKKGKETTSCSNNVKSWLNSDKPSDVVVVSDDENSKESVMTEKVEEEEDMQSLPSISPPPSPQHRRSSSSSLKYKKPVSNFVDVVDIEEPMDCCVEERPSFKPAARRKSSEKIVSTKSKRSSQENNFDDLFESLEKDEEYSLKDYLAQLDKKKKGTQAPAPAKSVASSSKAIPSTSSRSVGAKGGPIPSFSAFARQKLTEERRDIEAIALSPEKPVESYQINQKPKQRKKPAAQSKSSEQLKSLSASRPAPPPSVASSSTSEQQGPLRQKQPKDVLKMIILKIAENVISDELAATLIEKEIRFEIIDNPGVSNSVRFEHNVPYKMVEKDMQVHEKMHKEIDDNVLIIFRIDQHLELLQGELDRDNLTTSEIPQGCLSDWIKKIQTKIPKIKITLLIHGLDAYLRKLQRVAQKQYRDRVLHGDKPDTGRRKKKGNQVQSIQLSRYEVQNALISAQLETHINYRFYEKDSDLVVFLQQYAKSVAEAPYKQEKLKSNGFDWYAVADAVGGIPVEENGQGMRSLWLAQLQQFPKVGQESAIAIARVYGSPKELYEAYRRCNSVEDGQNLLRDIKVTMGVGPLAKTRRLGPEASKKIYRFFTSTDGEREIDS